MRQDPDESVADVEEGVVERPRMVVRADGAVRVTGEHLEIWPAGAEKPLIMRDALLCRCGRAGSKPFCDSSHGDCAFADPGEFTNKHLESSEPIPIENKVMIRAVEDGPLLVEGSVVIVAANGEERHSPGRIMLCRCGASNSKPFCDGRHGWIAFSDPTDSHDQ